MKNLLSNAKTSGSQLLDPGLPPQYPKKSENSKRTQERKLRQPFGSKKRIEKLICGNAIFFFADFPKTRKKKNSHSKHQKHKTSGLSYCSSLQGGRLDQAAVDLPCGKEARSWKLQGQGGGGERRRVQKTSVIKQEKI